MWSFKQTLTASRGFRFFAFPLLRFPVLDLYGIWVSEPKAAMVGGVLCGRSDSQQHRSPNEVGTLLVFMSSLLLSLVQGGRVLAGVER